MTQRMTHADKFKLETDVAASHERAKKLFARVSQRLRAVLPPSAEILHIGSTAIPGCLTKGDLDIVVRVAPDDFEMSDSILEKKFKRNERSARDDAFAAFEDETVFPHLGVQLTARGGQYDRFHIFAEALRQSPNLVESYNRLKRQHDGQSMDAYRESKSAFVLEVLGLAGATHR